MKQNPVFVRLTRRAGWLSPWVTCGLAFVMGLAALAWAGRNVYQLIAEGDGDHLRGFGAAVAGMPDFLLLALPAISGWIAAVVVARDTQSDEFTLQRLSPLSGADAARGYFGAALFSVRLLLAALVGWIPAMVVAGFGAAISEHVNQLPRAEIPRFIGEALVTGGLAQLLVGIGLFGAVVLGAALGVWMGLLWRRTTPAVALATLPGTAAPLAAATLLMPWYWSYWPLIDPIDRLPFVLNICWLLIPAVVWLAARAYDRGRVG